MTRTGPSSSWRSTTIRQSRPNLGIPGEFLVTFRGLIRRKDSGDYNNSYVCIFSIEHSLITEYVEYFNPLVLQQSFASTLAGTLNAERSHNTYDL
jgi:hypothetical protein